MLSVPPPYLPSLPLARSLAPPLRKAGHPPPPSSSDIAKHIPLLAAYGASTFNRTCSRRTFEEKGRSMQTEDMIPNIGKVFEEVFGGEDVRHGGEARRDDTKKSGL